MRICRPRCEKCRWKTSNVQHRTSNAEVSEDSLCHSMFGVGCSSGFMEGPPRTLIAPCALEPTHRPLTPSLPPSAGEGVPEGRAGRGGHGEGGLKGGGGAFARDIRWGVGARLWPAGVDY